MGEVRNPKSEISNPQSLIPNPLFSVRTPTAVVTDLGTEFGVEVDPAGGSYACVFQGKVELRLAKGRESLPSPAAIGAGDERGGRVIQLVANQAARVEPGANRIAAAVLEPGRLVTFVRQMPGRQTSVVGQVGNLPHGAVGQVANLSHSLPTYRLIDLGALGGGAGSQVYGINAAGQVVGVSTAKDGSPHGFLYVNGVVKDLGPLGGPKNSVYDINTHGQVVGDSTINGGGDHAFLYRAGTMKDLGTWAAPPAPPTISTTRARWSEPRRRPVAPPMPLSIATEK